MKGFFKYGYQSASVFSFVAMMFLRSKLYVLFMFVFYNRSENDIVLSCYEFNIPLY